MITMKFKRKLRVTGTSLGLTLPHTLPYYLPWVKADADVELIVEEDPVTGQNIIKIVPAKEEAVDNE